MSGVEQHRLEFGQAHSGEQALPGAFLRPAQGAFAHGVVFAKTSGQHPPRAPVPHGPEHRVQKQAVIACCSPHVPGFARQMWRQLYPRRFT